MEAMAHASPVALAFEAIVGKTLDRLLELRAGLDSTLARVAESVARGHLVAVLEHFDNFVATGDVSLHRAFLRTYLAMRAAEGQPPAAALSTLVTIGDTAAQVAQEQFGTRPEGPELVVLLTRVTSSTARIVNDLIADDLAQRLVQWREVRGA